MKVNDNKLPFAIMQELDQNKQPKKGHQTCRRFTEFIQSNFICETLLVNPNDDKFIDIKYK